MGGKASAEGQSERLSSLSRPDRDCPLLKAYEEYEEFSEDMNEYCKPVLNVFPKTKNKKSPPELSLGLNHEGDTKSSKFPLEGHSITPK